MPGPSLRIAAFYRDPFAALDWLEKAFGFERLMLITNPDGTLAHAEMGVEGAVVMIGAEWTDYVASPASTGGRNTMTASILLAEGLDAHCARAGGRRGDRPRAGRPVLWRPHLFRARCRRTRVDLRPDRRRGDARAGRKRQRPQDRGLDLSARLDRTLAALADPARRRMVEMLRQRPHRAGEIAARLRLNPPLVSRHLKVLRTAGLVESSHPAFDTRVRVYALKQAHLGELKSWLAEIEAMWTTQLSSFKAHVEGKGGKA